MRFFAIVLFFLLLAVPASAFEEGSEYALTPGALACQSQKIHGQLESWNLAREQALESGDCREIASDTKATLLHRGFFYSEVEIADMDATWWVNTESLKPLDKELIVEEQSEEAKLLRQRRLEEQRARAHNRIHRGAEEYRQEEIRRREEAQQRALERKKEALQKAKEEARIKAKAEAEALRKKQEAERMETDKESCKKDCREIYSSCAYACKKSATPKECRRGCRAARRLCLSKCSRKYTITE
ncbi:MAG: hypothetical protein ACOCWR_09140 [Oceanidesulfovibrio sp.]